MSKASSAATTMHLSAELLVLVRDHLDGASFDVMDLKDNGELGHAFMGSLSVVLRILDALIDELRGIAKDVDIHEAAEGGEGGDE